MGENGRFIALTIDRPPRAAGGHEAGATAPAPLRDYSRRYAQPSRPARDKKGVHAAGTRQGKKDGKLWATAP